MATVPTHVLNSVDGTHAGGLPVMLSRIETGGARRELLAGSTDDGGRFASEVDLNGAAPNAEYELVVETGDYFAGRGQGDPGRQISKCVVVRFTMADPETRYHIPMMLAPHSHSVWTSQG